jgi:hypothetical protein
LTASPCGLSKPVAAARFQAGRVQSFRFAGRVV